MNTQNLLKIISDLVLFETVYSNVNEFSNCIGYIKNYFKDSNLYIEEFEYNNSKSLIVSNHKATQFDVIFCGHIDVVPASSQFFTLREDGDILYGRGVCDMKGQVAVMMQIMRELPQAYSWKKVALFLTSDEERGGFDGVGKLLGDLDYSSNVAIVPDGGFNFALVCESKGVLQIKVTATGVGCHSSEPWNGSSAILKLFDIFRQIIAKFPNPKDHLDWKTSLNISKIEGGDSLNKVPHIASMYIDIRHIYLDSTDSIIDLIENMDDSVDVEILAHGEAFKLDKNNKFVQRYIDVCRSLVSKNIEMIKCHSASDGRFFSKKNIPCLIMNPTGGNIHCENEWVSLNSLKILKSIYEKYLNELP